MPICSSIRPTTAKKYLRVAFIDGVATAPPSGSAWRRHGLGLVLAGAVQPQHGGDAGQQQDDADHRPDGGRVGQLVAHQRLVRPVAGVGEAFLARAVGGGGPGGPEEEGGQRLAVGLVGHGVHPSWRTGRAGWRATGRCRTGPGSAPATARIACGALVRHRHGAAGGVVGVAAHLLLHGGVDGAAVGRGQRGRVACAAPWCAVCCSSIASRCSQSADQSGAT